jgi:hypothetical protein
MALGDTERSRLSRPHSLENSEQHRQNGRGKMPLWLPLSAMLAAQVLSLETRSQPTAMPAEQLSRLSFGNDDIWISSHVGIGRAQLPLTPDHTSEAICYVCWPSVMGNRYQPNAIKMGQPDQDGRCTDMRDEITACRSSQRSPSPNQRGS